MFELVEDTAEIRAAQTALVRVVRKSWSSKETRLVVWRPDSKELRIAHNGQFWFASYELDDAPTPRFWNSFGAYKKNGNLNIGVEINISTDGPSKRIAGFFARDGNGHIVFMHDGSLGGGRAGVGREAFLAFLRSPIASAVSKDGASREGVFVASLSDENAGDELARFVRSAIDFKMAVASGSLDTQEMKGSQQRFGEYFREYSGLKQRQAQAETEYFTRHGDIVEALRSWRALSVGEVEVKTGLIDWGVQSKGVLRELYEVKTSCARQNLYAGIGQLMVYEPLASENCKRFLVLPAGEDVASDIQTALSYLGIVVVRYRLTKTAAKIL